MLGEMRKIVHLLILLSLPGVGCISSETQVLTTENSESADFIVGRHNLSFMSEDSHWPD
jgi:hypothetical protein